RGPPAHRRMIGTRWPSGKGETTAGLENVPEAASREGMQGRGEPLRPAAPSELADDLPSLPDDLARIDQALRDSVRTPDPFLAEVAAHLIGAGGKRRRPTPTLCASYASTDGADRPGAPDSVTGAVACELVHLGSLYHDDGIDETGTPRGGPRASARRA